jgi:hypothetical protein
MTMQMGKICLTLMQNAEDALEDDNDDVNWQDGEDQLEPLLVAQGSTVAGEAFSGNFVTMPRQIE